MNIELVDERGKKERMPFLERQMVKEDSNV
jgi:hypothetical protein